MEKQNLFPILSSVKYNKLDKNDESSQKFGNMGSYINQNMQVTFPRIDKAGISANPILNDDNDSIIDGLFEKNHMLQVRWRTMQDEIDNLKRENERLTNLLAEEKACCKNYQEKLQYIQQNQPIIEKLKQAYISMKYNEQINRPNIEVNERSCQTLQEKDEPTRESHTCNEYYEPGKEVEVYRARNITSQDIIDCEVAPGYMPVKKNEFLALKQTVDALKTLIISQPLSSFVLSEQREAKYRRDITELFMDNRSLKQLVVEQQLELDSARQQLAVRKTSKETNMLKKIIAKLERQMRFANICTLQLASKQDSKTDLSEKEKRIVEHVSAKYEFKLQQKQEYYDSNIPRNEPPKPATPYFNSRPNTPLTSRPNTPFFTPRSDQASERTDETDTFRSCDDIISFDSI